MLRSTLISHCAFALSWLSWAQTSSWSAIAPACGSLECVSSARRYLAGCGILGWQR